MGGVRDPLRRDEIPGAPASGKRLIQPWKTLDLRHERGPVHVPVREHAKVKPRTDYVGPFVNVLVVTTGLSLTSVLVRFVHRAAGWNPFARAYRLLDGTLALSVSALVVLALAITLAIVASYARPRSHGYIVSALGALVVAVTLTCVALGSATYARLAMIPWALPLLPLGAALRSLRNAWARCADGARLRGFVLAALAGALGFSAVELWFGAGLGRFFHH